VTPGPSPTRRRVIAAAGTLLLPPAARVTGQIRLDARELLALPEPELRKPLDPRLMGRESRATGTISRMPEIRLEEQHDAHRPLGLRRGEGMLEPRKVCRLTRRHLRDATLSLGVFGPVLAALGLVWATNLFNFMDGIDGIAAIETLWVAGVGGLLLFRAGNPGLGGLALVLAGAALGFLRWNWPPAKIFLGDVGSGFIGFVLAALAIASENARDVPVIVWAMLFAAFIVDATITLARRFRSGLWHQPHKTHAYQRAVQAGWTHKRVNFGITILNLTLALLALATVSGRIQAGMGLLAAFGLCIVAYAAVERIRPFR